MYINHDSFPYFKHQIHDKNFYSGIQYIIRVFFTARKKGPYPVIWGKNSMNFHFIGE